MHKITRRRTLILAALSTGALAAEGNVLGPYVISGITTTECSYQITAIVFEDRNNNGTIETTAAVPNRLGAFHAVGIPVTYGSSGRRSFYVDESGVIRAEDNLGKEATELAPPLRDGGYSSSSTQRRYSSGDNDQ